MESIRKKKIIRKKKTENQNSVFDIFNKSKKKKCLAMILYFLDDLSNKKKNYNISSYNFLNLKIKLLRRNSTLF